MEPRFARHEEFLRFMRIASGARTYLEIGVESGQTLMMPDAPVDLVVGVDPAFKIVAPTSRPVRIALFRKTSDAFFEDGDYSALGAPPVDLTFVDGLHWCEFALRDVLNAERLSHAKSIILVHDIVPGHPDEAGREQIVDNWMGDVFKSVLALLRFRPDLEILCLGDIAPSGMAIITNLDPQAPPIDMAAAEAFMQTLDFERDFERLMRPLLQDSRSQAFEDVVRLCAQ